MGREIQTGTRLSRLRAGVNRMMAATRTASISGGWMALVLALCRMYEQGLRQDRFGLPPGQAASLGVHESQSRLWENLVGRSQAFWESHEWYMAIGRWVRACSGYWWVSTRRASKVSL